MSAPLPIAVGIITCKRPQGLKRLLESLAEQEVPEGCTLSAIVVDNDLTGHNQAVVEEVRAQTGLSILFTEEAEQGIPAARNASVRMALEHGFDAMIFVDDDETAPAGWLEALIAMWRESGADVVTGPVKGILPEHCPGWAHKSRAYDKMPSYAHGQELKIAYTNNTLVSRKVLEDIGPAFSMRFRYSGSSDRHYFSLARQKGYRMVWCPEALIHEDIPLSRISFGWLARRGFRNGCGFTLSRLMLRPGVDSVVKILCLSGFWFLSGGAKMLLSPVRGWKSMTSGLKEFTSGLGCFLALFGVQYQEYKVLHGD